ncbi:transcription initiation factor tfiid subunit 3 [Anaeramoeba flamelloides]|uniref:Transcription initiation factor tfiid subunit 3 n=1 Tax=Anaeramoeba flamelloides TaxID=1746091 RepID=A0ABQ8YGD3_9EUKA|nr:transcription initiation factor tfiid subunit 3 [Anaeramoeba flamelloides]
MKQKRTKAKFSFGIISVSNIPYANRLIYVKYQRGKNNKKTRKSITTKDGHSSWCQEWEINLSLFSDKSNKKGSQKQKYNPKNVKLIIMIGSNSRKTKNKVGGSIEFDLVSYCCKGSLPLVKLFPIWSFVSQKKDVNQKIFQIPSILVAMKLTILPSEKHTDPILSDIFVTKEMDRLEYLRSVFLMKKKITKKKKREKKKKKKEKLKETMKLKLEEKGKRKEKAKMKDNGNKNKKEGEKVTKTNKDEKETENKEQKKNEKKNEKKTESESESGSGSESVGHEVELNKNLRDLKSKKSIHLSFFTKDTKNINNLKKKNKSLISESNSDLYTNSDSDDHFNSNSNSNIEEKDDKESNRKNSHVNSQLHSNSSMSTSTDTETDTESVSTESKSEEPEFESYTNHKVRNMIKQTETSNEEKHSKNEENSEGYDENNTNNQREPVLENDEESIYERKFSISTLAPKWQRRGSVADPLSKTFHSQRNKKKQSVHTPNYQDISSINRWNRERLKSGVELFRVETVSSGEIMEDLPNFYGLPNEKYTETPNDSTNGSLNQSSNDNTASDFWSSVNHLTTLNGKKEKRRGNKSNMKTINDSLQRNSSSSESNSTYDSYSSNSNSDSYSGSDKYDTKKRKEKLERIENNQNTLHALNKNKKKQTISTPILKKNNLKINTSKTQSSSSISNNKSTDNEYLENTFESTGTEGCSLNSNDKPITTEMLNSNDYDKYEEFQKKMDSLESLIKLTFLNIPNQPSTKHPISILLLFKYIIQENFFLKNSILTKKQQKNFLSITLNIFKNLIHQNKTKTKKLFLIILRIISLISLFEKHYKLKPINTIQLNTVSISDISKFIINNTKNEEENNINDKNKNIKHNKNEINNDNDLNYNTNEDILDLRNQLIELFVLNYELICKNICRKIEECLETYFLKSKSEEFNKVRTNTRKKNVTQKKYILLLINKILERTKKFNLPASFSQLLFKPIIKFINQKISNIFLTNSKYCTYSYSLKIKLTINKFQQNLKNINIDIHTTDFSTVRQIADCITTNKTLIHDDKKIIQTCKEIAPNLTLIQIHKILSNFTPDKFDMEKIPKNKLKNFFNLIKKSQLNKKSETQLEFNLNFKYMANLQSIILPLIDFQTIIIPKSIKNNKKIICFL